MDIEQPVFVAKFDLTDARQRLVREAIHRTHTGRWPLFRMFGMVQIDRCIYEAVQWRTALGRPQKYSVLRWDLAKCGVFWIDFPSCPAAVAALRAVRCLRSVCSVEPEQVRK